MFNQVFFNSRTRFNFKCQNLFEQTTFFFKYCYIILHGQTKAFNFDKSCFVNCYFLKIKCFLKPIDILIQKKIYFVKMTLEWKSEIQTMYIVRISDVQLLSHFLTCLKKRTSEIRTFNCTSLDHFYIIFSII